MIFNMVGAGNGGGGGGTGSGLGVLKYWQQNGQGMKRTDTITATEDGWYLVNMLGGPSSGISTKSLTVDEAEVSRTEYQNVFGACDVIQLNEGGVVGINVYSSNYTAESVQRVIWGVTRLQIVGDPFSLSSQFRMYSFDSSKLWYSREYRGLTYGTSIIGSYNLELLANASNNSQSTITLAHSLKDYRAVVIQGVYGSNADSSYNTSMAYVNPQLNESYWTGMLDRNSHYDCFVTFTDDTTAVLSGTKHCLIYGAP